MAQLMKAVLHRDQGLAAHVQAAEQAGRHCRTEIAFDVDALVEIGFQQTDLPARESLQQRGVGAEHHREHRLARAAR